jgi:hypothetical protein
MQTPLSGRLLPFKGCAPIPIYYHLIALLFNRWAYPESSSIGLHPVSTTSSVSLPQRFLLYHVIPHLSSSSQDGPGYRCSSQSPSLICHTLPMWKGLVRSTLLSRSQPRALRINRNSCRKFTEGGGVEEMFCSSGKVFMIFGRDYFPDSLNDSS